MEERQGREEKAHEQRGKRSRKREQSREGKAHEQKGKRSRKREQEQGREST